MLLMIDNYGSFTYILVQYFRELGAKMAVYRNDRISIREIEQVSPAGIVFLPGPGKPADAGITVEAIGFFTGKVPLLGIGLGHLAIGQTFGGQVIRAPRLMHGKTAQINHDGKGVFKGLPAPFTAACYHSSVIDGENCPPELEITAWTAQREIMGLRHRRFAVAGVQFHPESILTVKGNLILANFLAQCQLLPESSGF